jgi:hypothetical protein
MPRFSAKEIVLWNAVDIALGATATACGSGKALKSASALVAGAAVAFGSAALVF